MAVLVTADAIKGKSTEDILGDFLDETEHGPLATAPGFGVHVLLRLHEAKVRAQIAQIIETDETLTPIAAGAVTNADIRAGCLVVAERTNLAEEQDAAVFKAALAAIHEAEQRLAPARLIAGIFYPSRRRPRRQHAPSSSSSNSSSTQCKDTPMGWLYMQSLKGHSGPRQYLDAQFTFERPEATSKVLRSALVGMRVYYAAVEQIRIGSGEREVWALICLVRYNPRDPEGYIFGYKDMTVMPRAA